MTHFFDKDIFTNDIEYFFSLHGPRFEYMNKSMANSLSKRFGKEFRPIRIFSAWPAQQYNLANLIVMNTKGYKLAKELKKPVVYLPDYEDVNVEFSKNDFIKKVANRLLNKQKTVYVYPFTTAFLELPKQIFTVIGPSENLARLFDNKVHQTELFNALDLPRNNAHIYKNTKSLLDNKATIIPCYLSASYTSGGNESSLIYNYEMLYEFLGRIRPINKQNAFVVADIFENIMTAPNVNALIDKNGDVKILVLSDQILQGNRYLGNLYPSLVSKKHKKQIYSITKKLGAYMEKQGYRGLFGCDFLIDQAGKLIIIDLNPRHQGGYACNGLALQAKGLSLTDIELSVLNHEDVKLSQTELDKSPGYAWGHSKLLPAEKGQIIQKEYQYQTIEKTFSQIGESFVTEFYQEGSVFIDGYIGYQVQTAKSHGQLEAKMLHEKERFNAHVLGL